MHRKVHLAEHHLLLDDGFIRLPVHPVASPPLSQGQATNVTYDAVCSGATGHTEAVQCTYDEKEVSYDDLLDLFFGRVDPTTLNRQGNDRGTQVRGKLLGQLLILE